MRPREAWLTAALLLVAAILGCAWLLSDAASGPDGAPAAVPAAAAAPASSGFAAALPDPATRAEESQVVEMPVATGARAAGADAAGPAPSANVRGRVLDQDGVPVPAVGVGLYRGATRVDATTDAGGSFHFDALPAGLYRLFVDGASLPDGLLPPWRQQVPREPEDNPDGVYGTSFRLTAGAGREVDLRVFAAGAVHGRIVDAGGAPLAGALVSVHSPTGVSRDARSDEAGHFDIERLHPGAYATSVRLDAAVPEASASAPLPARFELQPRQELVLEDLVAGSAGCVLRGAVVDLDGQPVAGLPVSCREEREDGLGGLWTTRTDEAGRYALGRVPPAALVLEVGEPQRGRDDGAVKLRAAVEPVRVDARGGGETIEAPLIRVDASRPFRVTGRLRVDPAWAPAGSWKASATVRPVDPDGAAAPEEDTEEASAELKISSSGAFAWTCATPHPEVEVLVVVRAEGRSEVEWRERLQPVPDEVRELLVDVP